MVFARALRKKAAIVDHSLMDAAGHHLNVAQALMRSLSSAGYDPTLYAHRGFRSVAGADLSAVPVFPNRAYDSLYQAQDNPALFPALARKYAVELQHVLRRKNERIVVFPTMTCVELPGLADWIENHPAASRLQVFFWLAFGPEFLTSRPEQVETAKDWYAEGFQALERAARTGARLCPIVETEDLAVLWQEMTGLPVSVIRLPTMVHHLAGDVYRQAGAGPVIGYGGDVRDGKGFPLLPEIVAQIGERHPSARFDIRVAVDPDQERTHRKTLDRLAAAPNVSLSIGSQAPLAFQTFLACCDLILLPYDPDIYALRGSSICDEAEALGRPLVVPEEAAFAQTALAAGTATGFDTHTAAGVAAALDAVLSDFNTFQAAATAHRQTVVDQNKAFLQLVHADKAKG